MSRRQEIVTSPEFIPPPNWGRKGDGTKFGFDVKDYTDELVAGILAVAGRACETKTPSQSPCWCEILNGKHSADCRRLRKMVKAAKGRRK